MKVKRLFLSILLVLVTFSLVACGKVSVSLKGETSVKVGETIKLTPEASEKKATFSWASSDPSVATVENGTVTGVKAGKATITVTATKGKKTAEASLEVTVVAKQTYTAGITDATPSIELKVGDKLEPLNGITAIDSEGNNRINDVVVSHLIPLDDNGCVNQSGEYQIKYTLEIGGEKYNLYRSVTVKFEIPVSDDLIVNGDFELGATDPFTKSEFDNGGATLSVVKEGENNLLKVDVTAVSWQLVSPRVETNKFTLENGKNYKLTFKAKADVARDIQIQVGQLLAAAPWFYGLGEKAVSLTTELQEFSLVFKADGAIASDLTQIQVLFGFGTMVAGADASSATACYLDDIKVEETQEVPPTPPTPELDYVDPECPLGTIKGAAFGGSNEANAEPYKLFVWYVQDAGWGCGPVCVTTHSYEEGVLTVNSNLTAEHWWFATQIFYATDAFEEAGTHTVTFKLNASAAGTITINGKKVDLVAGDNEISFETEIAADAKFLLSIQLGWEEIVEGGDNVSHQYLGNNTLVLSELKMDGKAAKYESKEELKDVDLLDNPTITKNGHEYSTPLVVSKVVGGGNWEWLGLKVDADLTGYTKVVVTVQGTEGEIFLVKPNDNGAGEARFTMDGTLKTFEKELPANFAWDANKVTMVFMPDADVTGKGHDFIITKFELQGEGKDPINLLAGTLSKSDACTARNVLVITKPTTNTGKWDSFWLEVENDITSYKAVKYVIKGTAGEKLLIKVNDQLEYFVTLNGEVQEGILDLSGKTLDAGKKAMILFANAGSAGTGNPITIYELKYLVEVPEVVEPVDPDNIITYGTFTALELGRLPDPANAQGYGSGSWDSYAEVVADPLNPGNKVLKFAYTVEGKAFASFFKFATVKPSTTYVIELDYLVQGATDNFGIRFAPPSNPDILKVFYSGAATEGWQHATFELTTLDATYDSIGLWFNTGSNTANVGYVDNIVIKEKPAPEPLKDVDLLDNPKITKNGHEYSTPLVLSKDQGAGEWRWVSLVVEGDLTGYTKLVATINGPDGGAFLFKVNDSNDASKWHTTNGADQNIEYDLPANFVWDAAKKTIFLFPDAGVAGKAQEYVITKLELQGEGKDPINLLAGAIAKDNEANYRNLLTITKPTSNTGEYDSFWLEVENDITSYKAVKYVVQGTAGEKLLIKVNDQLEYHVTLTGEVQEAIIDLSDKTLEAGKKAMILFANAGSAGTGHPITIYELKYLVEVPEIPEPPKPETVTHTFDASLLTAGTVEEETTVADYFTILPNGTKVVVDSSSKKCGDVSFTQRLKLGGKSDATKAAVKFTTKAANAKVIVYAYSSSGSEERAVHIFDASKTKLATGTAAPSGEIVALEYVIAQPGTYYVGGLDAAINIYGIVVEEEKVEEPAPKYADLTLDFMDGTVGSPYTNASWTQEKYTSQWDVVTGQMNCREKDGVRVVNFASGYSMTHRYTYTLAEDQVGVANKLSFKAGNYFSPNQPIPVKIVLIDKAGNSHYILGDANNFFTFPATAGLVDQELTFDPVEVAAIRVVCKGAASATQYLYVGAMHLGYEEEQPVSSPATFQLANLNASGNARNHIEGAGIWIWVDPTSIGYTAAEHANFSGAATVEGFTVNEVTVSDPSETAVRFYVVLASAPAADATVTVNLTITHGDSVYKGAVTFTANELAQ